MRIGSQQDFWSGLICVVVGVAFALGATNYAFGTSAQPGPGYFPLSLGIILALLGVVIVVGQMNRPADGGERIGAVAWRPLIAIIGSVLLFGVLLPTLGLLITLPVLVVTASLASKEFGWKASLINAVVLTAVSWLIFVKGLGLAIPILPDLTPAG